MFVPGGVGFPVQLTVMKKVASSEPGSWNGSFGSSHHPEAWVCAAYRGTQDLLVENYNNAGAGGTTVTSASVNNTDSAGWRAVIGCLGVDPAVIGSHTFTSNEVSIRSNQKDSSDSTEGICLLLADSNAPVATGSTSRTVSMSGVTIDSGICWIGVLEAGSATPATGVVNAALPAVTGSLGGDVNVPGTLSCTLPSVTATGAGFGQPPPVDGSMAATLPSVSADLLGGTPILGSFAMPIDVVTNLVGETRVFGVRVIEVEADNRTITVLSRGVDD
jgi:hypothetical protein